MKIAEIVIGSLYLFLVSIFFSNFSMCLSSVAWVSGQKSFWRQSQKIVNISNLVKHIVNPNKKAINRTISIYLIKADHY